MTYVNTDKKCIIKVGSSSFGQVHKAKWVSGAGTTEIVAAKQMSVFDKIKGIHRESTILSRVKHVNIVSFLGIIMKDDKLVILMDYADDGSVYDWLYDDDKFHSVPTPKRSWMLQCAKVRPETN